MYIPKNCAASHNTQLLKASVRLQTFVRGGWDHELDPMEFAEAGFALKTFSSKNYWDVYCVWCPLTTGEWMTEHPLKYHEQMNPRCPFVQGYDVGNFPIANDPIRGIRSPLLGNYDVTD